MARLIQSKTLLLPFSPAKELFKASSPNLLDFGFPLSSLLIQRTQPVFFLTSSETSDLEAKALKVHARCQHETDSAILTVLVY